MDNSTAPAYPTGHEGDPGLTKLERFTMAAMQGYCANAYFTEVISTDNGIANGYDAIARAAYLAARATLSKLSKHQ